MIRMRRLVFLALLIPSVGHAASYRAYFTDVPGVTGYLARVNGTVSNLGLPPLDPSGARVATLTVAAPLPLAFEVGTYTSGGQFSPWSNTIRLSVPYDTTGDGSVTINDAAAMLQAGNDQGALCALRVAVEQPPCTPRP